MTLPEALSAWRFQDWAALFGVLAITGGAIAAMVGYTIIIGRQYDSTYEDYLTLRDKLNQLIDAHNKICSDIKYTFWLHDITYFEDPEIILGLNGLADGEFKDKLVKEIKEKDKDSIRPEMRIPDCIPIDPSDFNPVLQDGLDNYE